MGGGKVRTDRRCGPEFPLEDGSPSECDGSSGNHCCSIHGYCGPGPDHCACAGCETTEAARQRLFSWWTAGSGWTEDVDLSSLSTTASPLSAMVPASSLVAQSGVTVVPGPSTAL